ncbi:MAG: protoporphyrinogen oxidase, partial [Actinomycetota bacterium]
SRLLSAPGLARAGLDVVLPRTRLPEDPSVGEVLRPRFGAEVFDRLVEPLLGGVHAGRADHLSARSTVPDLEALARSHRSLYLALRRRRRRTPTATPGPTLVSLDGGLGRLVDALLARLGAVDLRFGSAVTGLVRDPSGWRVVLGDGTELTADAVVLATPAYATAELLAPHSASGAAALREIGYVDVATVTLAYPAPSVGRRLDATGFLVPPRDGRLVVGCTWLSAKWPHLAGGPEVLVRCLVGRAGDDRWAAYDDAALTEAVHGELVEVLRLAGRPTAVHVQRWPKALPQYAVGHQDRLDRVAAALAGLPGLHVTGAAYRGAGVASCIAQAEQVARLVAATDVPAGVGR